MLLLLLLLFLLVFFILTHLATDCSHPLPQAAAFSLSFFIIINFHMKLFACPLRRCCKETARPLGDEIHERVLIDPPSGCVAVWTYFSPRLPASGAQRAPASKASAPFQHGASKDSHAPPASAIFFILLTSLVDVFLRSFFTCAVACHISVRVLPMSLAHPKMSPETSALAQGAAQPGEAQTA